MNWCATLLRRGTPTHQSHPPLHRREGRDEARVRDPRPAADRWCRVSISDLERHQLKLLRAELGLEPDHRREDDQSATNRSSMNSRPSVYRMLWDSTRPTTDRHLRPSQQPPLAHPRRQAVRQTADQPGPLVTQRQRDRPRSLTDIDHDERARRPAHRRPLLCRPDSIRRHDRILRHRLPAE